MAIQLDEATLIALILESLFFGKRISALKRSSSANYMTTGIFTVLFFISLYILILRKRVEKVNRTLVSVSVLMYIVAFVVSLASNLYTDPRH